MTTLDMNPTRPTPPALPARPTPTPLPNLLALRQPTLPLRWTRWAQSTKPSSPTTPSQPTSTSHPLPNPPTRPTAPTPRCSTLSTTWSPSYLGEDTVELVLRLARLGQPVPTLVDRSPLTPPTQDADVARARPLWRRSEFVRAEVDGRVAALRARRGKAGAWPPQVREIAAATLGRFRASRARGHCQSPV